MGVVEGGHQQAELVAASQRQRVGVFDCLGSARGAGQRQRGHRGRPAAVAGEIGARIEQGRLGGAVVQAADGVVRQLVGAAGGRMGTIWGACSCGACRLRMGEDDAVHLVQHAQLLGGEGRRVGGRCRGRCGGRVGVGDRAPAAFGGWYGHEMLSLVVGAASATALFFECATTVLPGTWGRIGRRKEK